MAIIRPYGGFVPRIAPDVFIAENATIIGDVEIAPGASIWYGAVLRGDVGPIRIGARSNVQDNAVIHMTTDLSAGIIGEDVVVGHTAIILGAVVGNGALVGMGSVLLDCVEIGEGAVVAAGSVVPPRMKVPAFVLVRGAPAKVARDLTEA